MRSMENPDPSEAEVERLFATFTCFGPVPRTCLKTIPAGSSNKNYEGDLEEYLGTVDREVRHFAKFGGHDLSHVMPMDCSRAVALMQPSKTRRSYTTRVATRWIAQKLARATEGESKQEHFRLFRNLSGQPALRTSAGWLFETYVHDWFRAGGKFVVDFLPVDDARTEMNFSTESQPDFNYFTDAKSFAKQVKNMPGCRGVAENAIGKYFRPHSKTQESFDGVVFNKQGEVILLQYTIASQHETKLHGIDDFLKQMPRTIKTVHLIFVIPGDRTEDYSKEQPLRDTGGASKWRGKIKQWRLVFPDKTLENMAIEDCGEADHEDSASEGSTGAAEGSVGGDSISGESAHGKGVSEKRAGGKRVGQSADRESAGGTDARGKTGVDDGSGRGSSIGEGGASSPERSTGGDSIPCKGAREESAGGNRVRRSAGGESASETGTGLETGGESSRGKKSRRKKCRGRGAL